MIVGGIMVGTSGFDLKALVGSMGDAGARGTADKQAPSHDRLRDAWPDFQQDIEKLLTFPLLSDVLESKTAVFIEAMGKATDFAAGRRSKSAEAVERYTQATRTAETKWQVAQHHAGWARRIFAQQGHEWGEWFESALDNLTVWRYCERRSRPDYTVSADQ